MLKKHGVGYLIAVLLVLVAWGGMMLSSCNRSADKGESESAHEIEVTVSEEGLECAVVEPWDGLTGYHGVGLSCNWEKFNSK